MTAAEQVTQQVTQQVTGEVTQQVTGEVTQQVTEQVAQQRDQVNQVDGGVDGGVDRVGTVRVPRNLWLRRLEDAAELSGTTLAVLRALATCMDADGAAARVRS